MTLLFLNTRDSVNGDTPHDAYFSVPSNQVSDTYSEVELISVAFNNLRYPINSTNNSLVVSENSGAGSFTLSIAENLYTGISLATYLSTQMTSASTQAITYTIAYNNDSKKLSFSASALNFRILSTSTCLEELGFDRTGMSSFVASIPAPYPVQISGSPYVDILSNLPTRNTSSNGYFNVLCRVPLEVAFGSLISYQPPSPVVIRMSASDFDGIDLSMRDYKSNPFSLPPTCNVCYTFKFNSGRV